MYRISSLMHPPWCGIASSNSMTWSERGKQFSAATLLHSPPQMLSASPSCVGDGFVHVSGVFYPWKKPTEKRGCQKKGNVALWALWKNVAGWRRRENIWDVRSKTFGILATFPVKYNDLTQRHSRYFRNPFKLTLRKVIQTYNFWLCYSDVTRRHPPKVGESLLFWGKPL